MPGWDEHWDRYRRLCDSLAQTGRHDVVRELQDARSRVNGLTDGWHDHLDAFRRAVADRTFSPEETRLVHTLEKAVRDALRNRG